MSHQCTCGLLLRQRLNSVVTDDRKLCHQPAQMFPHRMDAIELARCEPNTYAYFSLCAFQMCIQCTSCNSVDSMDYLRAQQNTCLDFRLCTGAYVKSALSKLSRLRRRCPRQLGFLWTSICMHKTALDRVRIPSGSACSCSTLK